MCNVEEKISNEGKNLRSALFTLGEFKFRHFRPVASETDSHERCPTLIRLEFGTS